MPVSTRRSSTRRVEGCGPCCCSFILSSGLAALFMWLSLRGSNPKCSIQDLYVPALDLSANSAVRSNNHSLYFDLELSNGMKDKGVGYDDLSLIFYYGPNTSLPIGTHTIIGFYQGHDKKTRRKELVETRGVPWTAAFMAVSSNGKVVFRLDLSTKVRYKILFLYTKRHQMVVGANVDVDGTGKKVGKKGIKLKSAASEHHILPPVGIFLIILYFLDLLL